jgi:tetratricopeptide (TPR) repeat protein
MQLTADSTDPMNIFHRASSQIRPIRWWLRAAYALAVLWALAVAPDVSAQLLDDIEVVEREDGVAVLIHFAAQIGYRRHVVSPAGDEIQVFFALNAADPTARGVVEDKRVVPAARDLPGLTVHYLSRRETATLQQVDLNFDEPVDVVRVGLGTDNRSLVAIVRTRHLPPPPEPTTLRPEPTPAPTPAAPTPAPPEPVPPVAGETPSTAVPSELPPPVAAGELSGDTDAMLARARAAVATGRYEDAVAELNQLLNLPPNAASSQALIGIAREGLGETQRARVEYELYLKLYPDSPRASRVRERIATLDAAGTQTAAKAAAPKTEFWGSVGQSYYGGQSRIRNETTIITPGTDATLIDIQDISNNDQSSIVTNVDANLRYRGNGWDDRFVLRDVSVWSFLNGQPSENRLSALYGDFKNERLRFDARVGRQSSSSGAVLGRFDGATLHYGIGPSWRAGAFGGTPAEPTLGSRKTFYGLTLDNDKLLDGMGFGVYAVEQRTEGLVDRRALGNEVRYFSQRLSMFSLFDYDTHFSRVNIASAQGALTLKNGATWNLLYDYRRSPPLQFTNALLGSPTLSLKDRIAAESREQLEREALGLTPVSKVLLLGALYPVSARWQLGSEFRVSSVSGTIATATLPAAAGTGNVYSYTLQAIGTGIFSPSTVMVFNANRSTSADYDAWLSSVNARFRPTDRWALEPTVRYYVQDNIGGSQLRRLSPTLRTTYQLRDKISLESEVSVESSRTRGTIVDENSSVLFYYIGYRAEF